MGIATTGILDHHLTNTSPKMVLSWPTEVLGWPIKTEAERISVAKRAVKSLAEATLITGGMAVAGTTGIVAAACGIGKLEDAVYHDGHKRYDNLCLNEGVNGKPL